MLVMVLVLVALVVFLLVIVVAVVAVVEDGAQGYPSGEKVKGGLGGEKGGSLAVVLEYCGGLLRVRSSGNGYLWLLRGRWR